MDLYFSPLACSLATRIALYEAGAEANYLEVDLKTKSSRTTAPISRRSPARAGPTLRTDDGLVLTENAAILQMSPIAFRRPVSLPAPASTAAGSSMALLHRHRTAQGILRADARREGAAGDEDYTLGKGLSRLDYLDGYLKGREFLLDLSASPTPPRHHHQLDHGDAADRAGKMARRESVLRNTAARPSIAKAMAEELKLYQAELARTRRRPKARK